MITTTKLAPTVLVSPPANDTIAIDDEADKASVPVPGDKNFDDYFAELGESRNPHPQYPTKKCLSGIQKPN